MFRNAVVRPPCRTMADGMTSADLGSPDFVLALTQHEAYVRALERCGVAVAVIEADEIYPDCCFIEDTALVTPCSAIITRPGAESRRGETPVVEGLLRCILERVDVIEAPGTLDAGDIMMVGDHFFIGQSDRTNENGAGQVVALLEEQGFTATIVTVSRMLHLKSGLAYLENNHLLACGPFAMMREFEKFDIVEVPEEEAYAANSIWVNDRVIMPSGFPITLEKIRALGYPIIEVDTSEFRKLDGGVSCLSLRF